MIKKGKDVVRTFSLKKMLSILLNFAGDWDITLAGGEPFVYPYLHYLAENLTLMGNIINLITNFSAPEEKLYEFFESCNNKLEWFNISVHLSQWEKIEEFYEKLDKVLQYKKNKNKSFHINLTSVVTLENFEEVKQLVKTIEQRYEDVPIHLQRVKYCGKYALYPEEIEKYLLDKGVTVSKEEANHINFYGRKCWGGVKFFYVESNGDIKRCYTKQKNPMVFHLGNLSNLDQVKIYKEPYPCLSEKNGACICHPHFVNEKFVTQVMSSEQEIADWSIKV